MKNSIHKGSHFTKYLKNTPWYLLSSLMTKGMGFLLLPVFTNHLTTEEFGTLATLESFGRVLPIFISLYLDAAFNRYYYKEEKVSEKRVARLFSTHFWFLVPWGVLVSCLTIFFSPRLLDDFSDVTLLPIVILVFTQLLNQLAIMVTLIWSARLLAKKLSILQIVMAFIGMSLTIYFLVYEDYGWQARIYALGFVALFQFLILLQIACKNKWLRFDFDWLVLKRSLSFSIPLLPNIVAGWITMFSDRIILAQFGKLDEVGLYSIAAQIATLMYVINDAITKVQGSVAMSGLTSDRAEAKEKMSSFIVGYFTLMTVAYFILVSFSRELLYFFTDSSFHQAYKLLPMLAMIYIISGFYRVFTVVISYHNATWVISAAAFIQSFANVCLNFLLIPKFGMYAAAMSSVFSLLLYTAFIVYISQRIDKISLNYTALMKISFCLVFFTALSLWFDNIHSIGLQLFAIKVVLSLFVTVFLLSLEVNRNIRDKLMAFMK